MGFSCLFGLFWKIMPIFSIWKRNFRVFSGLVMGASFENGISVSFCIFLENNANIFYLKTGFPFFLACDGNLWKIMPISSIWKRNFLVFFWAFDGILIWKWDFPFLGLWWEPLENNANIFYLKTRFPFFWACNGNLWKIMPISSIWKRNFLVFFWACDGILIWKWDFSFFGFVMGTSGK